MKTTHALLVVVLALVLACACTATVRADLRSRAAMEAAELMMTRFGAKAGRSAPALARRIEALLASHGEEALIAVRRGGPEALSLVERAGVNSPKVIRALATHGEGALVLSRPMAMKQFLRLGEVAETALVRHPGIAEPLIERGGVSAAKALAAVTPRNGRRIAMMLEGDLAKVGRHTEVLEVVAKYGDRATQFIWNNKGALAVGTTLTVFLTHPEECINGTRDITKVAGESVVAPVVNGVSSAVNIALVAVAALLGVLIVGASALAWKHGLPKPHHVVALMLRLTK